MKLQILQPDFAETPRRFYIRREWIALFLGLILHLCFSFLLWRNRWLDLSYAYLGNYHYQFQGKDAMVSHSEKHRICDTRKVQTELVHYLESKTFYERFRFCLDAHLVFYRDEYGHARNNFLFYLSKASNFLFLGNVEERGRFYQLYARTEQSLKVDFSSVDFTNVISKSI